MYTDPTKIQKHVVKVWLSDEESKLINSFVEYTGKQKAVLIRELIMEAAVSALGIQSTHHHQSVEVPYSGLQRTGTDF